MRKFSVPIRVVLLSSFLLWGCAFPVWGERNAYEKEVLSQTSIIAPEQSKRLKMLDPLFDYVLRDNLPDLRDNESYTSDSSVLYNLQQNVTLFLDYMIQVKNRTHLDRLAKMLLIPLDHLKSRNTYWAYTARLHDRYDGFKEFPFPQPRLMWVKSQKISNPQSVIHVEDTLENSQFLYLIARSIHQFLSLDPALRTPNMEDVIDRYAEIVLNHTYKRWIVDDTPVFQVRGWGCADGLHTHRQFIQKKLDRAFNVNSDLSYCNHLGDDDMWIVTGLIEMLAAHAIAPQRVRVDPALKTQFEEYIQIAMQLIRSRFTETELIDFKGRPVEGYNFDRGAWKDHEDNRYAGYTGKRFPNEKDGTPPVEDLSWDLAHMSRIVYVLNTLRHNKSITRSDFPSDADMQKMTNQLAYRVFSGTLERPLFNNFWDGSNGWYRVGYSGRKGFAHSPHDFSYAVIVGGYCRWKNHNSDLKSICDGLWKMISTPNIKQKFHRYNRFEKCVYENFQHSECDDFDPDASYGLFNFISAYDGADPVP